MKRTKKSKSGKEKRKKIARDVSAPLAATTPGNSEDGDADSGARGRRVEAGSSRPVDGEDLEGVESFYLEHSAGIQIGGADEAALATDDADEASSDTASTSLLSKTIASRLSSSAATPLERQIADIKRRNPGVVLFVECGYRYRFFGEDAEIAKKELNIQANWSHNTLSGSIPVHRLKVHLTRLVNRGYKVGIVRQTESALTKASAHKVFTRDLDGIYTKGTLVGESVSLESSIELDTDTTHFSSSSSLLGDAIASAYNKFILAVAETMASTARSSSQQQIPTISFALMAADVSTGEVLYDCFEEERDDASRQGLCRRLFHVSPCEILADKNDLSQSSLRVIRSYVESRSASDAVRVENVPSDYFDYAESLVTATQLCRRRTAEDGGDVEGDTDPSRQAEITELLHSWPSHLVGCFGALARYLTGFDLADALGKFERWQKLSCCPGVMDLTHVTARALELTENSRDGRVSGSLLAFLESNAKTSFGRRLLRRWLCRPLTDVAQIARRHEAVEALLKDSAGRENVMSLIKSMPDVERIFAAAGHGKCGTAEFYRAAESLQNVAAAVGIDLLRKVPDIPSKSSSSSRAAETSVEANGSLLLEEILNCLANSWRILYELLSPLYKPAALEGDKTRVFMDPGSDSEVGKKLEEISRLKQDLEQALPEFNVPFGCELVKEYVTKGVVDYLVEIPQQFVKKVPSDWMCMSMTKQYARFRPPALESMLRKLNLAKEELKFAAARAWSLYLRRKAAEGVFEQLQTAVWSLATFDVLACFAALAVEKGLARPTFVEEHGVLFAKRSFHPVVASFVEARTSLNAYVKNDVNLDATAGTRCIILSGPNMGGKSCYVKQIGVLVLMAQIGCFVPAETCRMSVFDNVLVRVGGELDEGLFRISGRSEGVGGSSFLGETQQVSEIMERATERSLVIIDEFGRGTATHDGTALACAVLRRIVEKVKCLCLFVTHFPEVCSLAAEFVDAVANFHMNFLAIRGEQADGSGQVRGENERNHALEEKLTFLFDVVPGRAASSFGLNAARLAGLRQDLLDRAAEIARSAERTAEMRRTENEAFLRIWEATTAEDFNSLWKSSDRP